MKGINVFYGKLDDIHTSVCYSRNPEWIQINSGRIKSFIPKNHQEVWLRRHIQLPMLDSIDIKKAFSLTIEDQQIYSRLSENMNSDNFHDVFDEEIIYRSPFDSVLCDKWDKFDIKFGLEYTKKWCDENGINYFDNMTISKTFTEIRTWVHDYTPNASLNIKTGEIVAEDYVDFYDECSFDKESCYIFVPQNIQRKKSGPTDNYLLIPKFDTLNCERLFIDQLRDKKIKLHDSCEADAFLFRSFFIEQITCRHLWKRWHKYKEKKEIEFTKKWCDENNVKY